MDTPLHSWPAPAELLADLVEAARALVDSSPLVAALGGNVSLKTSLPDVTGEQAAALVITADPAPGVPAGGVVALRLDRLHPLLPPARVLPEAVRGAVRRALLDDTDTEPPLDALLHAALPEPAVVTSRSGAVLGLSCSVQGESLLVDALHGRCVVVEEVANGSLVEACQDAWRSRRGDEWGLVVPGEILASVAASPSEALRRHLELIATAEALLPAPAPALPPGPGAGADPVAVAGLRRELCLWAGEALVLTRDAGDTARAFLASDRLVAAAGSGVPTRHHARWTGPVPLLGPPPAGGDRGGAPRAVLHPDLGVLGAGRTPREAETARIVLSHAMTTIEQALSLGGYRPRAVAPPEGGAAPGGSRGGELSGQVALVTGAASGIGRGCASALLEAGACVVGWDVSERVADAFDDPRYLGLRLDVTDADAVAGALARQVEVFGGLDILVVAAGIFPTSANLGELTTAAWRRTMAVNVDAVMELYGQAHPLLAAGYPYGRVVLIASKNVAAPGPGAAAYSSSKAAVTQLTRVAALEWAHEGIRVNMLHPDAVFDTGLWTPELLAARAAHYELSVEDYKRRNLLHAEVTSATVGRLAADLCTEDFACTTGAQIPVDGGNERVV
jgi:NAD(P)-dependent dehydrogenase (short-subunit alcohol dehydrogenase family)/rhamnose utilization protein RhaD (predicted bifunctional aldolase and dehydrogenase)